MNHQPFEEWLLDDTPLAPDQRLALEAHLSACAECRGIASGWSAVRAEIRRDAPLRPAPGFTARFQQRLEERLALQQRRLTLGLLLGFSLGAAALSYVTIVQQWGRPPSLSEILMGLFSLLTAGLNAAQSLSAIGKFFFNDVPVFVPLALLSFGGLVALTWISVWVLTIWRLPALRKETVNLK